MTASGFAAGHYRRRAHLTAAAVCLLFCVIQYVASTGRTDMARSECESRLNQEKTLIGQAPLLQNRLMQLQSEEHALLARLADARRQTPNATGEFDFLEQLAGAAETNEMTIQELKPDASVPVQSFDRTTIRMTAVGPWSGVCEFLAYIRNVERLCTVDELHISVADRSKDELLVTLTLGIFSAPAATVAQTSAGVLQ